MGRASYVNPFIELPNKMAMRDQCGSDGSRLHIDSNGEFVGYAQWPDAETRAKCELTNPEIVEARKLMRDSIERSFPEQTMTIKADFIKK
jgi:hypothetical protein